MSVRLSVCVHVPYPKAAPIGTKIVKRRTHECVRARRRAMAQESSTLVDHVSRPVVWTHSLPSRASATLGCRV